MFKDILKRGRNAVLIGAMVISPFVVHARADERTEIREAAIENVADRSMSLPEGKELTDKLTGINVTGHGNQEPELGSENQERGTTRQTGEMTRTLLPSFPEKQGFGRGGTDYARFYHNRASIDLGAGYFYEHGGILAKGGLSLPLSKKFKIGLMGQLYFEGKDNETVSGKQNSIESDFTRTIGFGGVLGTSYIIPFSNYSAMELGARMGANVYFENKYSRQDSRDSHGKIITDLSRKDGSVSYDSERSTDLSLNLEGCVGYGSGLFTLRLCSGYDFKKGINLGGEVGFGL